MEKCDFVVSLLSCIAIVCSVLLGCSRMLYTLLGLFPLLELLVHYPRLSRKYKHEITFLFGICRLGALSYVNSKPYVKSEGLMDYVDMVALYLICPSLMWNRFSNFSHIFLYLFFIRLQISYDQNERLIILRVVLKLLCVLALSSIGLYKCNIQERLGKNLSAHFELKKNLDYEKQNLRKAIVNTVGWKLFTKENNVDPLLFIYGSKLGVSNTENKNCGVQRLLLRSSILQQYDVAKLQETVSAVQSYNNVSRTDCILIAIKPFVDNALTTCEAQNVYDLYQISTKIEKLALHYGVTIVRKFGDVWIGCLGFFPGANRATSETLSNVLDMAKDIYSYGKENNIDFTCALDCGNIFCGFTRGIFQFEVLGPEIMWVMSVCEFENTEEQVFISASLYTLCKRLLGNQNNPYFFESVLLQHVDKFHTGSNYVLAFDKKEVGRKVAVTLNSENNTMQTNVTNHSSTCEISSTCNDDFSKESVIHNDDATVIPSPLHNLVLDVVIADFHNRCCLHKKKTNNSSENGMTNNRRRNEQVSYNFFKLLHVLCQGLFKRSNIPTILPSLNNLTTNATETAAPEKSGHVDERDNSNSNNFLNYRRETLEPKGCMLWFLFFSLLFMSMLCLILLLKEGWGLESSSKGQLPWDAFCTINVLSFFNWAVPIFAGRWSIFLPISHFVLFAIFPPCEMGIESGALVFVPTWVALCFSHNLNSTGLSFFSGLVVLILKISLENCSDGNGIVMFGIFAIVLLFSVFALNYILYLCYIVEDILIPYESIAMGFYTNSLSRIYKQIPIKKTQQVNSVSGDITKCSPSGLCCYQKCVVVAIHIKATETFSDVGTTHHVCNILEYIYSILDDGIDQFGIVGVSTFAGIHLSVVRDEAGRNESNIKRGVAFVQFVLNKFRELDQTQYVNLLLGVSLNYGSVNFGMYKDSSSTHFGISGRTRDKALQMALKEENKICFSSSFINEMRISFPEKSFKCIVDEDKPECNHIMSSNVKWYQLELYGAFSFAGNFGFSRNMKDYNYVETLGKGGAGQVHLLEDRNNKIMVAVKIINWNSENIDHLRRELSILQELRHQNIVKIKFYVMKRVEMFIVMEYVRGGTLQQVIDHYKPDIRTLRLWFMQLVLALEYIHQRGIVHRDVKPSNCMIDTFGILKLTDFGLALQDTDVSLTQNVQSENALMSSNYNEDSVNLSASSLKLMQHMFPSSVQYNTAVNGSDKPKEAILLVDDDKIRLEKTQSLLRQNFIVYSVNNDDEALDFLNYSMNDDDNANEINLIIISIDLSGDQLNGWGFLNTLFSTKALRDIPVVVLASALHSSDDDLTSSTIWKERLPNIKRRPKHIFYHPFDASAYAINKHYFDMICRLEKQRKHFGNLEASVFDKFFSGRYFKTKRKPQPMEKVEGMKKIKNDIVRRKRGTIVGTLNYLAPEVINKEECNEKSDWWSCGATFYYCVMGRKLFDRNSRHLVIRDILNVDIGDRLSLCDVPDLLKDLMHNMLLRNVENRFNSVQIKQHKFFESVVGNVSAGAVKKVFDPIAFFHLKNTDEKPYTLGGRNAEGIEDESNVASSKKYNGDSDNDEDKLSHGISRLRFDVGLQNRWTMAPTSHM